MTFNITSMESQWNDALAVLGGVDQCGLFHRIVQKYSESGRFYHTCEHVGYCLDILNSHFCHLDSVSKAELEIAIWFHDAIYHSTKKHNERASGNLAQQELSAVGFSAELIDSIVALILATEHQKVPQTEQQQIIVDVDLAILGSQPDQYKKYSEEIRREYTMYDNRAFAQGRIAVLRLFLQRDSIFCTDRAIRAFEAYARDNLLNEIQILQSEEWLNGTKNHKS